MANVFDTPPRDLVAAYQTDKTLGTSERYKRATLAELYYLSHQYDSLLPWESRGPLKKRRPREIVPLYKTTIDTIQRFVWSGARFPRLVIAATRNDDEPAAPGEVGPSLSTQDAKDLTTFALLLIKQAKLDRCAVEYTRQALVGTSAAVIIGTRGGFLTYYVEHGKHCWPTWSLDNPRELAKLEIVFQYEREIADAGGSVVRRMYWFRRIIDDQNDVVFKPVLVVPGVSPEWVVDNANSNRHGLGFCPVRWVRTLPLSSDAIDGQAVVGYELYPILDRINYLYSQRGRAIEYVLDPQWIRKNVSKAQRALLEKNPGAIWDIEDEDKDKKSDISLLEAKGTGSDAAAAHLCDLRNRFLESVGAVLSDPDKVAGQNISGVVLEYLHAPMIALASDLRKDLGDDAFADIVNMALRIVTLQIDAGKDVWVQGAAKAAKLMRKAQGAGIWLDFPIKLQWGRFFSPTAQDIQFAVTAATSAKGALVAQESATRFVGDYFGITDIDDELEAIDDEKQQAQQQAIKLANATRPPPVPGAPAQGAGGSAPGGAPLPARQKKQLPLPGTTQTPKPNRPGKA